MMRSSHPKDAHIITPEIHQMPNNQNSDNAPGLDNTVKNPADWKTGDEPMTGAQRSYLHTLAEDAGEPVDDNMTKAEASEKIDELRDETGMSKGDRQP
jgi:DUF3072 family protein